nr:phosphoribosyl-ATP pyrophosphohydrolase [Mycolicibacterium malmesburyense]
MSTKAYRRALLTKLHKQAAELSAAQTPQSIIEEAVDVLEAFAASAAEHGATLDNIGEVARSKREKRGGFATRLRLDAGDPSGNPMTSTATDVGSGGAVPDARLKD